ncbi:MAG: alternative ribosome rescue aminoacyl-tRNA hydrolase ArfB [Cyclobacteriaceae bacterium]
MSFANRLEKELVFRVSRSSGPGGQNVNKVNSKVTLRFDVERSEILTSVEKEVIRQKLAASMSQDGELILSAQESRSQLANKEAVLQKFDRLLSKAFTKRKVRKASKPSKSAVQERLQHKKRHGDKKKWRQKI